MNIIIATDSFKGSMTSLEAAEAIQKGIEKSPINAEVEILPMADGGEGTVDAFVHALQCDKIYHTVLDPIGRDVEGFFAWNEREKLAIIETAAASGLTLLKDDERDPYMASTYGTGQLMKVALEKGAKKVVIGIGGSATVDGGVGFLQALGAEFLDVKGNNIERVTGDLKSIHHIDLTELDSRLKKIEVTIASDVSNPLLGDHGAIAIFGLQKGVKQEDIPYFEAGMSQYAELTNAVTGNNYVNYEGAGASGGFGFTLMSYLGAEMRNGFEIIAELTSMEDRIARADLVISGEGKLDKQTFYGKGPIGVMKIAEMKGKPVILFAGSVTSDLLEMESNHDATIVVSILHEIITIDEAMNNGKHLLERAAYQTFKAFSVGKNINFD